jgi:uncharacterized protein with HEPN domain/predicted nucleotidyltransferase
MTHADLLKQHKEEIRAIVEAHRASNPRVFGSVRYGIDTPESDIDLLVDPEPGLSGFDLAAIQGDLRDLLGVEVDVLTSNGLPERMRERVLAEAEAIVEGDYGYGGAASMRDKSVRLPLYLDQILDAARLAEEFTAGMSLEAFRQTDLVEHAVTRNLQIVAVTVGRIYQNAPAFLNAHPELPLTRVFEMRDELVHRYYDLDLDAIWSVATEDMPKLKAMLLAIRQAEGLGDN